MGNNKNKKDNGNNHRYAYKKKKQPHKQRKEKAHKYTTPTPTPLEGSRIINLDKLQEYTDKLRQHSDNCNGSITLYGETRHGLATILKGHCATCNETIHLESSDRVTGPNRKAMWSVNLGAVVGEMYTGGGHSRLQETYAPVGVPVMTKRSFIRTEKAVGDRWKEMLQETMVEAGKEEKRLAEERGDYHEGVPAITVVVDGGWCKRSHKHSYNAKSGVAVIFGKETGKLLHLGVRNKYCQACAQNVSKEKHRCYKNWTRSSSEMETDIILEGFKEAEQVHGVRYTRFVGDGDSSVHSTLLESVPGWGYAIKKLECANHCCKCYRGALEKLVQDNPSYKGSGGLTKKMRRRLVSAARCAIRMRSKEADRKKAIKLLKEDLTNGPNHCFGIHDRCSTDFCSTAQARLSQRSTSSSPAPSGTDTSSSPAPSGTDTSSSPAPSGTDTSPSPAPSGTDTSPSPAPSGTDTSLSPAPSGTDISLSPAPSGTDISRSSASADACTPMEVDTGAIDDEDFLGRLLSQPVYTECV